jgi:hypothetical protein
MTLMMIVVNGVGSGDNYDDDMMMIMIFPMYDHSVVKNVRDKLELKGR